jgi:hypothetical protein
VTIDALISTLDALKSSGAPLSELVAAAVRGLHEGDDRFDWTGVYELGADGARPPITPRSRWGAASAEPRWPRSGI